MHNLRHVEIFTRRIEVSLDEQLGAAGRAAGLDAIEGFELDAPEADYRPDSSRPLPMTAPPATSVPR